MAVVDFLWKLEGLGYWRERCASIEAAKKAATLAAVLVPNYWSFYGEPAFQT